jgi:hypothetical protein
LAPRSHHHDHTHFIGQTPRRGRRGGAGIRLHRARSLDARDTTTHQTIPITTVARTLLDLAATARAEQLERAFSQALALRFYDHAAITDVLQRANGHRGTRALAEAIAREPKHTKSEWEARMLALIRGTQLQSPSSTTPSSPRITAAARSTSTGHATT